MSPMFPWVLFHEVPKFECQSC